MNGLSVRPVATSLDTVGAKVAAAAEPYASGVAWFSDAFDALLLKLSGGRNVSGTVVSGPGFFAKHVFLTVRPLTIADEDLLTEFYAVGLSDESRRLRFLVDSPRVPSSSVHYLADRNGRSKVGLIAVDVDVNGRETIVGVVEYALDMSVDAVDVNVPEVA